MVYFDGRFKIVLHAVGQISLVAFGQMLQIAFVSQAFAQIGLVKPAVVCGAEYQTDLVRVDFDELVC